MTEVQTLLEEMDRVYAKIQALKKELESLQTVEQAQAEYDKLLSPEEANLTSLEQQKRKLEVEQRSLTVRKQEVRPIITLSKQSPSGQLNPNQTNSIRPPKNLEKSNQKKLEVEARENFKKQINRFYRFELNAKVLGQINRIADDVDRPLGEALALLKWEIFQDYASKAERDASKLKLLKEWTSQLQDYHNHLSHEVEMQEYRFCHYIAIWEKWRTREESTEWQEFIAKTRQEMQVQAAKLEDNIRQLEEKIEQIKVARGQSGA